MFESYLHVMKAIASSNRDLARCVALIKLEIEIEHNKLEPYQFKAKVSYKAAEIQQQQQEEYLFYYLQFHFLLKLNVYQMRLCSIRSEILISQNIR